MSNVRLAGVTGMVIILLASLEGWCQKPFYTGDVLPRPREVVSEWSFVPLAADRFEIELSDPGNKTLQLAQKLLRTRLTELGGAKKASADGAKVTVLLGLLRSPAVKTKLADVNLNERREGYAIRVFRNAGEVVIVAAGVDCRGAFYGAMTLLQQMGVENGRLGIKVADLNDWPEWQHRYVSDYGPSGKDSMLFLARNKINGFAIQHRWEWREFAPETPLRGPLGNYQTALNMIKEFKADTDLVDFMLVINIYAAAPRKYPWFDITREKDIHDLINVCSLAADHGIIHVMICVDDWTPSEKGRYVCPNATERKRFGDSVGKAHAYLMMRLYEAMKKKYPTFELSIVPPVYSLVDHHAEQPEGKSYLKELASGLPEEVFIVWTGPRITSPEIKHDDFKKFSRLVNGHRLFPWDNSECLNQPLPIWRTKYYEGFSNDSQSRIFLNLHGFGWPWVVPFDLNVNDYLWNPQGYDEAYSYRNAVEKLFGLGSYAPAVAFTNSRVALAETSDTETKKTLLARMDQAVADLDRMKLYTAPAKRLIAGVRSEMNVKVPQIVIPHFDRAPVIDGNPDADPQWEKAVAFEFKPNSGTSQSIEPGTVKIGYDDKNLYLAFILHHTKKLPVLKFRSAHDDNVFESSDAIELFIQPGAGGDYAHLVFDFKGNRFDELSSYGAGSWDPAWTVAVIEGKGRWTAEVVIPFLSLQRVTTQTPIPGTVWRANCYRAYNLEKQRSAWSPTVGHSFHNTNFFGKMTFGK